MEHANSDDHQENMHPKQHMTPDRDADISEALKDCRTVVTSLHGRSVSLANLK